MPSQTPGSAAGSAPEAAPARSPEAPRGSGIPSQAPEGYVCPFCGLVAGDCSDPGNRCELEDVVYQDEDLVVLIACDGFGDHEGHAMIIPAQHYENLYEMPDRVLQRTALMARQVALAIKRAWNSEGTSTRQHNEKAGNQHVWHYHLHVFPRYSGDMLYRQLRHAVDPAVRAVKAKELAAALDVGPTRL
ncbi:HIT family protein [Micrococcus lylae]|uniref:HIT family protein n=1 Tax=Micrococcus lylae TaxID=1273 RepID=A0ABY2JXJ4_9MICC|nr:HIT family protein [Micrococcus lylae]MCT2007681.1 HIT family protein [Micrococcus lylae]MCT2071827.1 HIT family protein [Micrococcus lylae]TFH98164.1 HIT family protein [Micrococcus lylae]WIK81268.1 HIT family protein [Micrococcus lylae]